jgi:hypothetical protein
MPIPTEYSAYAVVNGRLTELEQAAHQGAGSAHFNIGHHFDAEPN